MNCSPYAFPANEKVFLPYDASLIVSSIIMSLTVTGVSVNIAILSSEA